MRERNYEGKMEIVKPETEGATAEGAERSDSEFNRASRFELLRAGNRDYEKRLLTVEEASQYLSLHPQTVYVMARQGELPILKVGRAVRFDKLALDQWIQRKVEENQAKLLPWSDDRC